MFDSSVVGNISAIMAFLEGVVSFFSPCVLPLLPIYLGYLSGSLEDKAPSRKKTLIFTMTFIVGIFVALLLLNVSVTWISVFFKEASIWFMRIGGILIILLGIIQLGLFRLPLLERTFHIKYDFAGKRMNLALAFLMGFTFSFSWTPCIGPALASILILASSSGSFFMSTGLVICYAIGFALPFLIISFFSKEAVKFFRNHDTLMQVIMKVGAIILILMGCLMFSGHLSILGGNNGESVAPTEDTSNDVTAAPQFSLKDQNDQLISLSDYKGKIIYINFWGTWCGVCESELPAMKQLYEAYKDSDEVAVITVVYPSADREKDVEGIKAYLKEHEIDFPVLFDEDGSVFSQYGIRSFPTLFMIDKDQSVYGYLSGGIDYDTMENIIQQVRDGKKSDE